MGMTEDGSERRIAVLGTGFRPTGTDMAPKEITAIAGAGFRPQLVEPRFGAFPRTPYDRGLAAIGNLDAGIAAEADGFAAIFLNTFGDYGIVELRSALHIPVIGAGEAAMMLASVLGRRFAVVTVWPRSMNFIYDERLGACSMRERCAGIVNIVDDRDIVATERGDPDDPVTAMRAGSAKIVDRILAGAETILAAGDVDTIILGCTCMAPIGQIVAARLPVPVIESMTAGYRMAETLVALGLSQSPLAYPKPPRERLARIGQMLAGTPPQSIDESQSTGEDCPVCVFAADEAAE
jgi:allantoin racemase